MAGAPDSYRYHQGENDQFIKQDYNPDMQKLLVYMLLSILCYSCKVHKLTSGDKEWQPYKVGDILIFESNKGEIDTINITNINHKTSASDPLAVFPTRHQTLFVKDKKSILELEANEHGHFIEFKLRLGKNKLKYPFVVQKLDSIHFNPIENNAYKIEAKEYYDNIKYISVDLLYIYWSKEYGYTKLEFKDNYYWELKYLYRNKKNILIQ